MGRRGTKPLPPEVLKINGTFREDRHGSRAKNLSPQGFPQKPSDLTEAESAFWDSIVPRLDRMGILKETDAEMLGLMCRAYVNSRDQSEKWQYQRDWLDRFMRIAGLFGMSPSDRSRITIEKPKQGGGLEEMIG